MSSLEFVPKFNPQNSSQEFIRRVSPYSLYLEMVSRDHPQSESQKIITIGCPWESNSAISTQVLPKRIPFQFYVPASVLLEARLGDIHAEK